MTAAIRGLIVASVAATALLAAATTSAPPPTTCNGTLAPGTYTRLVVPDGATCVGEGNVTINGGLSVGAGATFLLGDEETPDATSVINGGVQATNPKNLQIHFATINGGI